MFFVKFTESWKDNNAFPGKFDLLNFVNFTCLCIYVNTLNKLIFFLS